MDHVSRHARARGGGAVSAGRSGECDPRAPRRCAVAAFFLVIFFFGDWDGWCDRRRLSYGVDGDSTPVAKQRGD